MSLVMAGTPHLPSDLVDKIRQIARRHGVRSVKVFGSTLRGDWETAGDLDLLVRMEPGRTLLDLIGFEQEVEAIAGRPVDVVSESGLSPHLADEILRQAMPL